MTVGRFDGFTGSELSQPPSLTLYYVPTTSLSLADITSTTVVVYDYQTNVDLSILLYGGGLWVTLGGGGERGSRLGVAELERVREIRISGCVSYRNRHGRGEGIVEDWLALCMGYEELKLER